MINYTKSAVFGDNPTSKQNIQQLSQIITHLAEQLIGQTLQTAITKFLLAMLAESHDLLVTYGAIQM